MADPEYEIITANKFHPDTGYQFKNYSKDSIRLTNQKGKVEYFPKSCSKVFIENGTGKVEVHIEKWLHEKKPAFFIGKIK